MTTYPTNPIPPYYYLLDDRRIWKYDPDLDTWSIVDFSIGEPLQVRILNNKQWDSFDLGTNYALNKLISGSAPIVATHEATKLVDGNLSTYWQTTWQDSGNTYLIIDLGESTRVEELDLYVAPSEAGYNPENITLQGSNDYTNWDILLNGVSMTSASGWQYFWISYTPKKYRYFKLIIDTAAEEDVKINELKLVKYNYPVTSFKVNNHGVPIELHKYSRQYRRNSADGYRRTRPRLISSNPTLSPENPGVAGDYVKVEWEDKDGVHVVDNISFNGVYAYFGSTQWPENFSVDGRLRRNLPPYSEESDYMVLRASNDLIICTPRNSFKNRGAPLYIKISYGSSDTNGTILPKIGYTDGQQSDGITDAKYGENKGGTRWTHWRDINREDSQRGIFSLDPDRYANFNLRGNSTRWLRVSAWVYDINNTRIRFNESEDIITVEKVYPYIGKIAGNFTIWEGSARRKQP